jgi:ABC-type antimicrobial peptide transport system permease subunit
VVVGVVHDVTTDDVREKPGKLAWLALAQGPVFAGTIAVRTAGDVSGVAASVRNSVRGVEPNLPIRLTTTLVDEIGDSFVSERAIAQLSSFFAALALVLSAIGLYGTISFAVARRTSEIGIRLALGAERVGVLGMVMRDAMTLVAAGSVVGLPLAFVAGRVLKSMLYGLSGFDVVSAVVAVVVLALVAAFAGYLPARRAANLDPMVALRYE